MTKSSLEASFGDPPTDVVTDTLYHHHKAGSESDLSSLESLLNDGLDDTESTRRIHPFDTPAVSHDPHTWPKWKKMWVATTIALYTTVVYAGSSIFMVSVPGVMIQYGVSQERALLGLSLYVFGYGLGPLVWAPLTEIRWIGRNPVYIFTMLAFVGISFLTAYTAPRSLSGFLALRFFQAFFGSPCLANGGASMHDIFNENELPYALGVWIAFAYAGPALGPALAAYPSETQGWQFPMWLIAYCSVPICLLIVFLPETYLPKILYRQGSYARVSDSEDHAAAADAQPEHSSQDSAWHVLKDSLIKPVEISILDPSVNFVNLYTSFCYATYYTFFDALPVAYMLNYGFSLAEVAVACTCIMFGCGVGAMTYFSYIYFIANPAVKRGQSQHEDRLRPALVAVCLVPVGICIFAFTSNGHLHWSVGMSGIAIYSGAVFVILQCLSLYVIKSYPNYAASLFAANDACRSVLAAGAVHVGVPFYMGLGIVKGCSTLAIISTLGIVGMWVLWWKGPALRARSKFATK